MNKRFLCCGALLAAAVVLAGCGGQGDNQPVGAEVSIRETVEVADPAGAAAAIYETIEARSTEELDAAGLNDYMNIAASDLLSFVAYRSEAKNGLCDLAILQPAEGKRDQIREALYVYKEQRVEEFRNYDILDSFSIAENAVIVDQGDYVILLMVADTEGAQDILDDYIPQ